MTIDTPAEAVAFLRREAATHRVVGFSRSADWLFLVADMLESETQRADNAENEAHLLRCELFIGNCWIRPDSGDFCCFWLDGMMPGPTDCVGSPPLLQGAKNCVEGA